ncbi:CAMK family protein kinase [Tritrichomonas foetus]|uniref:CAMK family protein kinase n=1 Tax=Tritrichomonas foetus TaxID=1144522 RepID=A0A1J4KVK4_9EUKA|nr:CAMK family protein kinase [Tritrichomonas foetus]|eukprot:OHT13772.1 CAMK family protein kinase [Tritrichomonas foetus]
MEEAPSPPFSCPHTIRDYTLVEVIGSGAFSVVYKAIRQPKSEIFALKIIPKRLLNDEKDQKHLQRELDTMVLLKHENIVQLHDFFADADNFYLVIDFCSGGTLFEALANGIATSTRPAANPRNKNSNPNEFDIPKLRDAQIATLFKQIVSAVGFCHDHDVAHRDLKMQNILVTNFPNVKLADFGLCGYIFNNDKMSTFCGSPCYTAPECLKMTKYDGRKSDIWSLGVILYELSTFEHPWDVDNVPKMISQIQKAQFTIPPDVTPALADLIKSLLRVNPKDRLTCEQILGHPWMKLSPSARRQNPASSSLPPLNRYSVPALTSYKEREKEEKDHGIVSPFLGLNSRLCKTQQFTQITKQTRSRSGGFQTSNTRSSGSFKNINQGQLPSILTKKPIGLPKPRRVD